MKSLNIYSLNSHQMSQKYFFKVGKEILFTIFTIINLLSLLLDFPSVYFSVSDHISLLPHLTFDWTQIFFKEEKMGETEEEKRPCDTRLGGRCGWKATLVSLSRWAAVAFGEFTEIMGLAEEPRIRLRRRSISGKLSHLISADPDVR